jgi:hypothetical protein
VCERERERYIYKSQKRATKALVDSFAKEKILVQKKCAYSVLFGGSTKGKRPQGKPGRRWRMILKQIFKKWNGEWTGLMWLRTETIGMLSCQNQKFGETRGETVSFSKKNLLLFCYHHHHHH